MNMKAHRDIKILFSAMAAAFLLLVGLTNVGDYATNLSFVQQVTRMEGLFSGEALRWRSIQASWAHHVLYVSIIAWELGCGLLAGVGAWRCCS